MSKERSASQWDALVKPVMLARMKDEGEDKDALIRSLMLNGHYSLDKVYIVDKRNGIISIFTIERQSLITVDSDSEMLCALDKASIANPNKPVYVYSDDCFDTYFIGIGEFVEALDAVRDAVDKAIRALNAKSLRNDLN